MASNLPLPAHLNEKLSKHGRLFIQQFDCKRDRMQAIVRQLVETSRQVKTLQAGSNAFRFFSALLAGAGVTACLTAVVLAGTPAPADKVAVMAAVGCASTVVGSGNLVVTNINKTAEETASIGKVDVLMKEFTEIVESLKEVLEEIQAASMELEEKSSSLTTPAGAQAGKGLSKTKQFEKLLAQTAELADRSFTALEVALSMQKGLMGLLRLLTQVTPTPENDAELRNCITRSASQCEKTFDELRKLRKILMDYEEMQE